MKTWLIVKKDTLEIQKSYTYESEEKKDSSAHFSHLLAEPICAHFELPEGMFKESVKAVLVPTDPEAEPPVSEHIEIQVDAALETARLTKIKVDAITVKYNELQADVLAEMATVFNTTKPESAQAYHETWKKMKEGPSAYAGEGLTAEREVRNATNDIIFAEGDALDTNQKVTDYATRLLEIADLYAITRMKRIKQFRDEKAAILAG